MKNVDIYKVDDFIKSEIFSCYSEHIKQLMSAFLFELNGTGLEFVVKKRKDSALALALKDKVQKNIGTVWVYEKHLRLNILNLYDKKIYSVNDISEDLIYALKEKYTAQSLQKKQVSIYIDESLIGKIDALANEEKKKFNDVVTEALQGKVRDVFISSRHKLEFSKLIRSAGLYDEEKNRNYSEAKRRIIALFYLISAFQDEYLERCGDKFSYDMESKSLKGPTYLLSEWEMGAADGETMLALGWYLLKGEESGFNFSDILWDMGDGTKFFLALNALR